MEDSFAEYSEALLPEYKGNPLIECLPMYENADLIKLWRSKPLHEEEERQQSVRYRRQCVSRLGTSFRYPLPSYLDFYCRIEEALLENYGAKNPLLPSTTHFLHNLDYKNSLIKPRGDFKPRGKVITLLGYSGVGKTTMLESVLAPFKQVYLHNKYEDSDLQGMKQITHITVECPASGSTKSLCRSILKEINRVSGVPEIDNPSYSRKSREELQDIVEMRVRSNFIGIIVIDEIQNLNNTKEGKEQLHSFILQLVNESGVVFVFSGNHDAESLLTSTHRHARRGESGGIVRMTPFTKGQWESFLKVMWKYQWTCKHTKLTQKVVEHFYKLTGGFVDHSVRVFQQAQKLAMSSDTEEITCQVLTEAFKIECEFSKDWITQDQFTEESFPSDEVEKKPRAKTERAFIEVMDYIHPEFIKQSKKAKQENLDANKLRRLTKLDPKSTNFDEELSDISLLANYQSLAGI